MKTKFILLAIFIAVIIASCAPATMQTPEPTMAPIIIEVKDPPKPKTFTPVPCKLTTSQPVYLIPDDYLINTVEPGDYSYILIIKDDPKYISDWYYLLGYDGWVKGCNE